MSANKIATFAAAALLSVSALALTAGSASAAQDAGFDSLLASTSAAQADASVERSDRDAARIALLVARSLAAQGDTQAATAYLNFARGKLGLGSTARDAAVGLSASGDAVGHDSDIASHSSYR